MPSVPAGTLGHVPQISAFYGIVIQMFYSDHEPAHFHARYAGEEALVEIATGATLRGSLPLRARRLVAQWLDLHREELEANWHRAREHEVLLPIEPLP